MEVITDPEVDAVWICSPSQFHADQIKACAANGKHVFCEKPIATDLAETVEAINACNEAGVKLMIGLQRRFDPNFLRVRQAIEAKEVGDTIIVSAGASHSCYDICTCMMHLRLNNCIYTVFSNDHIFHRSRRALATRPLLRMSMSRVVEESSMTWLCMILT